MIRKLISYIPSSITCLNLISGCMAVFMTFHLQDIFWGISGQSWVYTFIAAAAVFDFCDGLAARMLKAYSDIGKELDSLSDLVSFGVAPGMLMLNIMMQGSHYPASAFAALLIPVCGALRLAKFNVDTNQTTVFTGLPIPANAIFWIGMAAWLSKSPYFGSALMIPIIILISLAMVSRIRMFSLKFKNLRFADNIKRYAVILAAIAFVTIYGLSGLMWTIILYISLSMLSRNIED